eukprot:748410-Hanusia_phi.AAC.1
MANLAGRVNCALLHPRVGYTYSPWVGLSFGVGPGPGAMITDTETVVARTGGLTVRVPRFLAIPYSNAFGHDIFVSLSTYRTSSL